MDKKLVEELLPLVRGAVQVAQRLGYDREAVPWAANAIIQLHTGLDVLDLLGIRHLSPPEGYFRCTRELQHRVHEPLHLPNK